MVVDPTVDPELTVPDEEPILATAVFVLVHVPPLGVPLSVVADTVQIVVAPLIEVGGFTLTTVVA